MSRSTPITVTQSLPTCKYGIVFPCQWITALWMPVSSGKDNRTACPCCAETAVTTTATIASMFISPSSCGAREVETLKFNRGDTDYCTIDRQGPAGLADGDSAGQSAQIGLCESHGFCGTDDCAVANHKGPISRHSRDDDIPRMDCSGVPESRDVEALWGRSQHFLKVRRARLQKEIRRKGPKSLCGRRLRRVSCRADARPATGGVAVVNGAAADASVDNS